MYFLITLSFGAANPHSSYAQELKFYSGIVSDSSLPVTQANVFIVNSDAVLLNFAITDSDGRFQISLSRAFMQQPLWIEATCVGYKKERLNFDPNRSYYEFKLVRDPVFLSEVKVASRPKLQQIGDTLRYIVSSFAEKEDRSIGEVLRRMPGIKVMDDGTIFYNDKQIENLYIQGDDLMSGKYGTATKVIRKEMIRAVDVIQNHQPIQVLKDKVFSDKTSVNLILADENSIKLAGGGSVGLGFPELYDISGNLMLLNKRIKFINVGSLNNAGVDYTDQLQSQGSGNMGGSIDKNITEIPIAVSTAQTPNISRRYYYDNHSSVVNLNNLYNLKNGLQLKANVQWFRDRNYFSYSGVTQNFAVDDTIIYSDEERLRNHFRSFAGNFQLFANKEKVYFNNVTKYKLWQEDHSSELLFNENGFIQGFRNRRYELSNDLHWMPALRSNKVLEFRWLFKTARYRKQLVLYDGYISSIRGHEGVYDSVIQQLKDPVLLSHAYISGKRSWNWGTFNQNIGWIMEDHLLRSSLSFLRDGSIVAYSGDDGNYQRWKSNQYYLGNSLDFRMKKLSGALQLPLTWQHIRDVQKYYQLNSSIHKLRFNPALSLRQQFNPEKYLSLNYHYNAILGDFTHTYIGRILKNYRNISAGSGIIPFNKVHRSSLSYGYQQSIRLFFFNAGVSYSHLTANTMISADLADSLEQTILTPEYNVQKTWSANAGASKFIFAIKLNTSVKFGYNVSSGSIRLNQNLVSLSNRNWFASIQFTKRFSELISLEYNGRYDLQKASVEDKAASEQLPQTVKHFNETIKTSFIPGKNLLVDFLIRHAVQKNESLTQGYLFGDAKIRYTLSKKRIDLNIETFNLFGVKRYVYLYADSYQLLSSYYDLRGRMVLLKMEVYL